MIGEFTEKARTYENIAKANGLEITKELKDTITDYLTYENQKKSVKTDVIDKVNSRNDFQLFIKENFGSFYFNFYKRFLDKIEPQYLTRFLYLCTYLDYEGRLVKRVGKTNVLLKESELQFVLKLSRTETYNTKIVLINNNLIEVKDNVIYINQDYCRKGDIMKNSKVQKVRMFDDGIRELYETSTKTEHKRLALLFQLLPYVNLRWNVICKNPKEEILEEIKPYSVKELMLLLEQTNITRFKKSLLDLTVNGKSVFMFNKKKNGDLLTVNPKVYYKGVNVDELKYLIGLFSV